MIWVYAISSVTFNYIYVGMSYNVEERVKRHNQGKEKTTRPYMPFKILYLEECKDRACARIREKYWKSGTGKEQLKELRDKM